MKIEFRTAEYQMAHGHKPKGIGSWCMRFEGREVWFFGTFTEAKRMCTNEIRRHAPPRYPGTVLVEVCS